MSDPTQLVISACFLASLGIALTCMALRFRRSPEGGDPPSLPAGKVATWFYRPLDLIGPGVLFLVFSGLFLLTWTIPKQQATDIDAFALVFNIGFQAALAGGVIALALQRTSLDSWLGLRWPGWYWVLLIGPCSVLLMWGVFFVIHGLGYMEWMESLGVDTVQDTVRIFQESDDYLVIGLMAITAVFVAPVCEEIVFRGYFYPVLKKYAGIWPAALCSALIFAAAHGNLTVLLPLFILGALLVWLYEWTGSLWAPVAVHFCFNAATVVVQLIARHSEIPVAHWMP